MEPNIRDANSEPCHQSGYRCHVHEPVEHLPGTGTHTHEGEDGERGTEDERVKRETVLESTREDRRRVTRECETKECTGGGIQIGGRGGPGGGEEGSVNDTRKTFDTSGLDCDNERRGRRCRAGAELGIVGGH